jgi:tRNA (guanine-N7-)-methyltransferase
MNYDILTSQVGVHKDLSLIVKKHAEHTYQRPIANWAKRLFTATNQQAQGQKIILDSGCGTGMSSLNLAKQYPHHLIIGIDRSFNRLNKASPDNNMTDELFPGFIANNVLLIRANLIDIWPMIKEAGWNIEKHYLLYPNPYPKAKHVKRRFHGHPIFPILISLSDTIEVRSNWRTYLDEFLIAARQHLPCKGCVEACLGAEPLTLFEKKYWQTQTNTYKLTIIR